MSSEESHKSKYRDLYRALLDRITDSIELVDAKTGQILDVNDRACEIHGYTREEYLSLHAWELDPKIVWEEAASRAREARDLTFRSVHRRKDGSEFPVELNITYMDGDQDFFLTVVRDITQRVLEEEDRRRQLQLLGVLDSLNQIVVRAERVEELAPSILTLVREAFHCTRAILFTPSLVGTLDGFFLEDVEEDPFSGPVSSKQRELKRELLKWLDGLRVATSLGPEQQSKQLSEMLGEDHLLLCALDPRKGQRWLLLLGRENEWTARERQSLREVVQRLSEALSLLLSVRELRHSERKLEAAQRVARLGYWTYDREKGLISWSRQAAELFGLGEVEVSTVDQVSERLHPEDRDGLFEQMSQSFELDGRIKEEFRVVHSDGSVRYLYSECELVSPGDEGNALFGVTQDITERREAEESLRERDDHFRLLIEKATDLITVLDREGTIVYKSPSVRNVLGYKPSEVLGLKFADFVHPDDRDEAVEILSQAFKGGDLQIPDFTVRVRNASDEWIYLQSTGRAVPDYGEEGSLILNSRNITEQMELQRQLFQAQKMEAVGRLAGGVAHDFNNILSVIIMQSELVAAENELSDEVLEDLKEVCNAAERAAHLTRQLLLFSRKQIFQPERVELCEVVSDLAKMLQRIIGEDIRMRLSLATESLTVRADPGMLDQVILNLVVNARDAMPRGGLLVLETALERDESSGQEMAVLRVRDSGVGIEPELVPRIFEPFFTTKEKGRGTGLGLATVYGIVEQHKGRIEVSSQLGQGTDFTVLLPMLREGGSLPEETVVDSKLPGGRETILLVEDEDDLRRVTRKLLEGAGYEVLEASDGSCALELWQEHQAGIDILISDLVLPLGMNGMELSRMMASDKPELSVLFVSGYATDVVLSEEQTLKEGLNFLQKPYTPHTLLRTVRGVLG